MDKKNFCRCNPLLSDASILNKLAPFFTLILSAIFLKEKTNWKQFLLVALAFIGMLFVVRPEMHFSESMVASVVGVIGGFGAGAAYTCVRALGKRGMPSSEIVFGFWDAGKGVDIESAKKSARIVQIAAPVLAVLIIIVGFAI